MRTLGNLFATAAIGMTVVLATVPAHAQDDAAANFPSSTVTVVVPAAAGSQSDIFARRWAEMLQSNWGSPVIIENQPGAGGVLGGKFVADAAPDGLTLLYGSNSPIAISPQVRSPMPYDTTTDLSPVLIALKGQSLVVVNPALEVASAEELVAYAKKHPGELNFGSHGVGSFSHVAMELFMQSTEIEMEHIPYNGGGPLVAGFLAGEVDVVLFDVYSAYPQVTSGAARAIAQVGESRSPLFPELPLVSETVAPGVRFNYYFGILAPAGTPKEVVEKLNADITAVLMTPEMQAEAEKASMVVPGGNADEAAAEIAQDWMAWGAIIGANNIVAE